MKQFNQAHIEVKQKAGSDRVMVDRGSTVDWLNIHSDKPKAKFDITIKNQLGQVVLERKQVTGESNRYGERINLDMSDSYYDVEVSNVEGAEKLDVFLD